MAKKEKLTAERIAAPGRPVSGELTVYDTKTPGFAVRVRSSGVKTYFAMYRTPGPARAHSVGTRSAL